MRHLHLLSLFFLGAGAVTVGGWGMSLSPFAIKFWVYGTCTTIFLICLALSFAPPIIEFLGCDPDRFLMFVFGTAAAFVLGSVILVGVLL